MNRKISMDNSIIGCKTDKLGRLTLPSQYRRALGIKSEEEVSMMFTGDCMLIFKESEDEILERKCNDIMRAAFDCENMSETERVQLSELLMKLIGEGEDEKSI